jgi:PAS domain S-box-containing protein
MKGVGEGMNDAAFSFLPPAASLAPQGGAMADATAESMHLFLVEDDPDHAILITKCLERAGHTVTLCRHAADALIVLRQGGYDLILLDQLLPDMAGIDLLKALAADGILTPVLMVTGKGDENLARQVLQAGAVDYVVKDIACVYLTDLPKRVREAVRRHSLQQTNRLLGEALESARDGIMITDLQGCIQHVNQALERMTGYTREELRGQNLRLLWSDKHPSDLYTTLWRTVLARASWQGELTNRCKDGSLVEVSLTVSPIVDTHGQLTHFVGILRDITDRKLLERQLRQAQKMESVGTLAGGVAHEFNNLLAGINGYAALGLREPGLTPALREFLQHVVDLSDRAATLTRQMLAFARKPTLLRQPTRLDELARATAELIGRTLHTEVRLDVRPDPAEPRTFLVAADANQLQQALVNLALNARDAQGLSAPILFRVRRAVLTQEKLAFPEKVPPGDYVLVEVCDQGCGMSPEVLEQALDPFFTTKDVGKGTGLGLPVVLGIVHGHHGCLVIDSAPSRGTCVGLYLPRLSETARPEAGRPTFPVDHVLEPERAPGRNILVIDDEVAVQDVVRRFLEIAGHHVTCVGSGAEALELLTGGMPLDLAILDWMMPREDGHATFHRLRQRRPRLPILLCTGLLENEPSPQLMQAGPVELLRKPFRMNELWYSVNQALAAERPAGNGS